MYCLLVKPEQFQRKHTYKKKQFTEHFYKTYMFLVPFMVTSVRWTRAVSLLFLLYFLLPVSITFIVRRTGILFLLSLFLFLLLFFLHQKQKDSLNVKITNAQEHQFIHLFIEGLLPSQPHRTTSGLFTSSNLAQVEYKICTLHKCKTHKNTIWKLFLRYCSGKKWQIKLGDGGTIDHFSLAFQYHYQINKIIKKNGQKQMQIKNTV